MSGRVGVVRVICARPGGNNFTSTGGKTITVTVNDKTATFKVNLHTAGTVTGVSVSLSALVVGTVEQPLAADMAFIKQGESGIFTAVVQGVILIKP
jgi:hypothetical protein